MKNLEWGWLVKHYKLSLRTTTNTLEIARKIGYCGFFLRINKLIASLCWGSTRIFLAVPIFCSVAHTTVITKVTVLTSQNISNKQYLPVLLQIRLYKWNIFLLLRSHQETIVQVHMTNHFNAVYRIAVAGKGVTVIHKAGTNLRCR